MANPVHTYEARVVWEGNLGAGTSGYAAYSRSHRLSVAGKPDLAGTSDPAFRGEPGKHNPEDLFLLSLSACHMLFYLSLCARNQVVVLAYEDDATGTMRLDAGGGGRFERITLRPKVTITRGSDAALAAGLHDEAHRLCFIANSCAAPIRHLASVHVEERR